MEGELHDDNLVHEQEEDSTSTPENVADSALSGDEAVDPIVPSPRKSRKGAQKKVISVPIDGADGSPRSKGEVYPPSDSWSWRKYGQKPIKGSPYPRGYYRCSSSKGCPARKQVERSRLDPTMLLITYSHDHNHRPLPRTTTKHHHRPSANAASATTATSPASTATSPASTTITTNTDQAKFQPEEFEVFADQPDNGNFSDFTAELGWFSDLGSTAMIESSTFMGPKWADADFAVMLPIGEEDQFLFGDLGELPEYSVVFRHRRGAETPCYGATG